MENIFNRELAYHYSEIWLPEIKKRVFNILWETPENMLVLSSIWFIHKYANFYNLYEIIKNSNVFFMQNSLELFRDFGFFGWFID